jgi:hypothetical protein
MMKKLFLLLIFVVVTCTVNAQARFGIKGGLNFCDYKAVNVQSGWPGTVDASTGWNAGIFAQFKLLGLALQPELLYAERGTENTSMKYIDLPVNLRINLFSIPKTLTPFIIGGPYLSYALDGEVKMTEIVQDFDYKKFDYGLGLGVGCDLLNRFQLTGRYDWGFEKTGNVEDAPVNTKARVFTLSLGLYL